MMEEQARSQNEGQNQSDVQSMGETMRPMTQHEIRETLAFDPVQSRQQAALDQQVRREWVQQGGTIPQTRPVTGEDSPMTAEAPQMGRTGQTEAPRNARPPDPLTSILGIIAQELGRVMVEDVRVEQARIAAMADAAEAPQRRDEEAVKSILSKIRGSEPLSLAVRDIRDARKPTMQTKEHYVCDGCSNLILHAHNGYIVHGNVLVADPKSIGGLIGNNIPEPDENGMVRYDAIKKTVYCRECFAKAIQTTDSEKKKDIKKAGSRDPRDGAITNRASGVTPSISSTGIGPVGVGAAVAGHAGVEVMGFGPIPPEVAREVLSSLGLRMPEEGPPRAANAERPRPTSTRDIIENARREANARAAGLPVSTDGDDGGMGPIGSDHNQTGPMPYPP